MQYLLFLLFSFSGRISRAGFWLGLLIIMVLSVGGMAVLQPELLDFESDKLPPPSPALNIWNFFVLLPSMAITVKRLNDRNWPIGLAVLVFVVVLPFYIGPFFGLLWDIENSTPLEVAMWVILIALAIFLLVENGFLRGDQGDNRYGTDPLNKAS